MKRRIPALVLLALLAAALLASVQAGSAKTPPRPPKGFFGIGPQTGVTPADARYMRAGGIESVRVPVAWQAIQPTRKGGYQWGGLDETVETATRAGLRVLPFIYGTPRWLARNWRTLPVSNGQQRAA